MSEETIEITEQELDKAQGMLMEGLEATCVDMQNRLSPKVDSLSTKQLRKALKYVINYPVELKNDLTEKEQEFYGELTSLLLARVQLEIQVIGQLQKEYENAKK